MRLRWVVFLALSACAPPKADRGDGLAGSDKFDACFYLHGEAVASIPMAECLEGPVTRMRGVWVKTFEESSFIPCATAVPAPDNMIRFRIELHVDEAAVARMGGLREIPAGEYVAAIDFLGRRDEYATVTGGSEGIVVADAVISARYLGLPSAPDFDALLRASIRGEREQPLPRAWHKC